MNQAVEAQLHEIIVRAEQAAASGASNEAARLLAQAEQRAPDHPLVLNIAAILRLNAGDPSGAKMLLDRAIERDAGNPSLWVNLASSHRKLNQPDDEMRALERALAIEPRHMFALLQKASLLELQGKSRAAASVYKSALETIPPGAQLPLYLQGPLQRAAEVVKADTAALETILGDSLREVRVRHAREKQSRFDHCIDTLLGKRAIFRPQPTFMCFPKVPAWEFYDRDEFPWLDQVEAATADIRAEFERVITEDANALEPYIAYPDGVPLDQWKALNRSRRWSAFYLWREGRPLEANLARCPKTAALLAQAPRVDVPDHGPTAFYSILDAKTRIPPHTGGTNTRLIVHVPLVIPPGCGFRVGSETREWQPGKAWVFDDTIEHEAWNNSDVPRGVLIFDIWNPYLTTAERDLVRAATAAIREYYRGHAQIGDAV